MGGQSSLRNHFLALGLTARYRASRRWRMAGGGSGGGLVGCAALGSLRQMFQELWGVVGRRAAQVENHLVLGFDLSFTGISRSLRRLSSDH